MKTIQLLLGLCFTMATSYGQLRATGQVTVRLAHWHTIVRDVEATKKFWALLGGVPVRIAGVECVQLPGVLIFLQRGSPSGDSALTRNGSFIGPSQITALDHFGFSLNNGKELLEKVKTAGVRVEFIEGRQFSPESANIFTPDGLRVEMSGTEGDRAKRVLLGFSGKDLDLTVASDHLHYYLPGRVAEEAQSWYEKLLGATPLIEANPCKSPADDVPGVRLRFCGSGTNTTWVPTKGRALDRIGFDVSNLETLCRRLQEEGVKFDLPYSKKRYRGYASAELTDPWGTSIELTEGLNRLVKTLPARK